MSAKFVKEDGEDCDSSIVVQKSYEWIKVDNIDPGFAERTGHGMTCIDSLLYIFGGSNYSVALYHPSDNEQRAMGVQPVEDDLA